MMEFKYDNYEWVMCPECQSPDVAVERNLADRGGTESLVIDCPYCPRRETVIP